MPDRQTSLRRCTTLPYSTHCATSTTQAQTKDTQAQTIQTLQLKLHALLKTLHTEQNTSQTFSFISTQASKALLLILYCLHNYSHKHTHTQALKHTKHTTHNQTHKYTNLHSLLQAVSGNNNCAPLEWTLLLGAALHCIWKHTTQNKDGVKREELGWTFASCPHSNALNFDVIPPKMGSCFFWFWWCFTW